MAIDMQSMLLERLPSLRGSSPMQRNTFTGNRFTEILKLLQPQQAQQPQLPPPSSQAVAAQTSALPGAAPDEESGFSIFNALFAVLDAFGRPIRGVVGAGTAAATGNFEKAGERLLDAALSPLDALTFNVFDIAKEKNQTTGSDILDDLGWKSGTTTEDERRIRIAMAAGLSRRDAMRQFGMKGDRALSEKEAAAFESIINKAKERNPDLELGPTMDDFKAAVDAQDFGGFAVEVLLDPLTYLSMGATVVGKAARATGSFAKQAPQMVQAVRAAGSKDEALKLIRATTEISAKQKDRLSKQVGRAWDSVKEGEKPSLYLADNWAKQTREGQRAMFTTLGGKPLIRGGPVAEVLSLVGQSKTAEEILGKPTVSGTLGRMLEMPKLNKLVGGVKGLVQFTRDKMDTKTGVGYIDNLLTQRDADARTSLTLIGRTLNAFDQEIKTAAGTVDASQGRELIADAFHGTNREFKELNVGADRIAIKDKPGRGEVRGLFFSPHEPVAGNYVTLTLEDVGKQLDKASWFSGEDLAASLDVTLKGGVSLDRWAQGITEVIAKQSKEGLGWFKGSIGQWVSKQNVASVLVRDAAEGWRVFEVPTDKLAAVLKDFAQKDPGFKHSKLAVVPITKDLHPRVLKKSLYGKTVDLTDATKWPPDLVERLKNGTGPDDARVYKLYQEALGKGGQFRSMNTIERSSALQKWLKDSQVDIVKKPENDAITRDFSYWVLNQDAVMDPADAARLAQAQKTQVGKADRLREARLRRQVYRAVELVKQTGGDEAQAAEAARVALGMSNTALEADTVAKVAAGIVRINNDVLDRASQVPTRIRELNDDTIQYLHHMATPEAKELLRKQAKKRKEFEDLTGLEFNARSKTFMMRSDASRGKSLDEINAAFKEKNGIDLFSTDPIASTRESVRLTQRAIANAKFGAAFVDEYKIESQDAFNLLEEAMGGIPDRLMNMRKAAEIDAATSQAAARVAREEGKTHIGEVAGKLRETRSPVKPDLEKIPEGPDIMGVASYFRKVLKEQGLIEPDSVTAFEIYNRLGLKMPEDVEGVARLMSVTVPKEAAAFVTRAVKLQKEPGPFLRFYDEATAWLKASVTVLFPAFHGRNMLENTFKNFVEGNVNPRNYKNATKLLAQAADLAAGSPDWVGKASNKVKAAFQKVGSPDAGVLKDLADAKVGRTFAEIADWLVANGVLDNRITSEFGEVLQDGIQGTTRGAREARSLGLGALKELGTQGGAIRTGFALSSGTENLHRVSLFLDRISKGYNALEAAADVKRVFFDYRAMTNFESTYLKRMGFFYNFYRNNLRYIVQNFFTRPQMTKQILRLFQNDPDNPKQRWLSDKGSFTAGAKEVALGFIPQQQFNMFGFEGEDIFDKLHNKAADVVGMANPLLTTPAEVVFDKDLFTGGPLFTESNSIDWSFAPESVQNAIGYRETADGKHKIGRGWQLLFGAVPVVGRFSSTAIQLTSKERTYWEKLTRVMNGVAIGDRDLEKEDLALIDRNLMRAKADLKLIQRDGRGNYRFDTATENGRVASALIFPSKGKFPDLALQPEILFELKPYMTFDKDGKVRITDALRLKMHEVAVKWFPREQAFFDGVEARSAAREIMQDREPDKIGDKSAEAFNAFLQGSR